MEIRAWLTTLGLDRYAKAFAENDVDGDVLTGLTGDDLKEMGVASIGHRRKLLEAIASMRNGAPPVAVDAPPEAAAAKPHDAERRQLTVMFVDLVGSTALSARLDPEDMRGVIQAYQNAVAGEVARFEGHVAKFMGDGVLAYFGWPRAHEDEAERAVRSGLAIAAAVGRLDGGGAPLACRIGIATGLVVVGDLVGEGASQEQAVVGDTPNLAARLQEVAKPGKVVVAEATRQLFGDVFELAALGPLTLKGLGAATRPFAVLGERTLASRFAARQAGVLAPIVGRDQELAVLVERWREATAGEGQAILLTGEAGIGKSRISEALVAAVAEEPHVLIRYQCSPYHGDSALYPIIQQLTQSAGFVAEDTLERRLERLEALFAKGADDGGAAAAPLIAALLGLDGTARYGPLELTPQQRRNRTLQALVDQLGGLSRRNPVLCVIEDAHWIDPTTLELIELTLDSLAGRRVLLLVTARPTFVATFASHPVVTRLALNRLARAATQAIVARITGGKHLPEALVDEIAAKTDGVPLFVEEMTKAVVESGALRETAEAYELDGPLTVLAVPATLHDSLMARLDRLHGVKEVAQTAAIIGRSFDHATLAALSELPEAELADAMQRLVAAELVFRRGTPPDATYLFKHALVRDAAYESLLKSRRATLHGKLYDVLEASGEAPPEIMGQHAEAAGRRETALDHWEQAGRAAVARPAFREAIAAFGNAIRLTDALGSDARWQRREQALQVQLGQALIASAGYQGTTTLAAFERALALADELGDTGLQLPAVFGLWAGRYIAAAGSAPLADRFAALANDQPDSGPRLIGLRMLALEAFHAGRFRDALAFAEDSLSRYRPEAHGDLKLRYGHDPRVAAGNYKSWSLWHLGFPDRAAAALDEAIQWMRQMDHPNTTGLGLCFGVALTQTWMRRPNRIEQAAREMLRLADAMWLELWHVWGLIHLGTALFMQGTASGIDEIEAGLREARQIDARRFEPLHVAILAEAKARAGHREAAGVAMAQAFAELERSGDMAFAAELHRTRAKLALVADRGARAAAEADLLQALAIARDQEALALQLRAARDLAALWADAGERSRATELLAPIFGAFTEGFDTPDLIEAQALLDGLG